jgi:hypothetical protein
LGINKREEALHRDKKAKTTSAAIWISKINDSNNEKQNINTQENKSKNDTNELSIMINWKFKRKPDIKIKQRIKGKNTKQHCLNKSES